MQLRVERQLRSLSLAKACAAYGARVRTIGHLTGLPPREILRLVFPDRTAVPRGRCPDSPEWYFSANLLFRSEASILMVVYQRLREASFGPADALLGAYGHYLGTCRDRRISFDRAFDLASHLEGRWLTNRQSFALAACNACQRHSIAAVGTPHQTPESCPMCRLVVRYSQDARLQASFPAEPLLSPDASQLALLDLMRRGTATDHEPTPLQS
jgi:flagellar transcriptional activator FlhC